MDLVISPTSPYARKVRIVRLEKGLQDRVQVVTASPLAPGSRAVIQNPLGKVPSLILDDGTVLFDSPVICAYLDAIDGAPSLTDFSGDQRWDCDRAQALGDGIMDAAYNLVMERRRDPGEQSASWLERWQQNIAHAVAAVEQDVQRRGSAFDIGSISCAVALGYLDFRLSDIDWWQGHADLRSWYETFIDRPSFQMTDYE